MFSFKKKKRRKKKKKEGCFFYCKMSCEMGVVACLYLFLLGGDES